MKELLLKKSSYLHKLELEQFYQAMCFAEKAHEGQFRVSGEPYIVHPFAVAEILLDYKADIITLVAGLLHDVVEDTHVTIEEIQRTFGKKVAEIVEGLTKVDKDQFSNKELYQAVNLKKLLLASEKDIRVAIIKVVDRLHNMRTLQVKAVKKQVPYASETLKVYSPLCKKLRLLNIQQELEDLSFLYLKRSKYKSIKKILQQYAYLLEELSQNISHNMQNLLEPSIVYRVHYEMKPMYTAYSSLKDSHDVAALSKIIVTTTGDLNCYKILGIIHQLYKPVPLQFEDHIAIKNDLFNHYLKTKVEINHSQIEICIETESNQQIRDQGIFHLLSKNNTDQAISYPLIGNSISTNNLVTQDALEFCDLITFEFLQDTITVFTPQLDPIHLPQGSTAIDFAFAFNPDKAIQMKYVKINGEKKSVTTTLSHLDRIELLVMNKENTHMDNWLNFANSSHAQIEINKQLTMN
ncbi:HD domain-containing protein [Lysinibacillus cavernae]|uniref:HD domain-containing protein n=1 Tax=Lysinibacillus cavernae TaxID=2666135 RepID=UPI0012D8D953|nr:HD domain-containing protein [Lysinibacillus cavernae]